MRDFEARRERLQQRVSLIEELRRGQTAPVHMLDQVSRSLPDMMWLTKMTQTGYDVTIEGNCLSLTSLSDFVANLESSRYFARPVEIVTSEVVAGHADRRPSSSSSPSRAPSRWRGCSRRPAAAPAATPPKKGGARG